MRRQKWRSVKLWKVGYKNSYFNVTPAGKDNTILRAQKCCGLMSPNLCYLLLHHIGFVLSWTSITNTIPNHIHKERKTMWRPDILITAFPNIRVIRDLTRCHWLGGSWRSAGTLWYCHQVSSCQTRYSNWHWRWRQYRPSKHLKLVTWQHSVIVPRTWMLERKPSNKIRFTSLQINWEAGWLSELKCVEWVCSYLKQT